MRFTLSVEPISSEITTLIFNSDTCVKGIEKGDGICQKRNYSYFRIWPSGYLNLLDCNWLAGSCNGYLTSVGLPHPHNIWIRVGCDRFWGGTFSIIHVWSWIRRWKFGLSMNQNDDNSKYAYSLILIWGTFMARNKHLRC